MFAASLACELTLGAPQTLLDHCRRTFGLFSTQQPGRCLQKVVSPFFVVVKGKTLHGGSQEVD